MSFGYTYSKQLNPELLYNDIVSTIGITPSDIGYNLISVVDNLLVSFENALSTPNEISLNNLIATYSYIPGYGNQYQNGATGPQGATGPSVQYGLGLTFSGATVSITNTTVTANTYGNDTTVPSITFNDRGQAIAATAVSISITSDQITNFTSSVSNQVKSGTGISVVNIGGGATISLDPLGSTSSYGSANTINTFTYNNYGQITTAGTVSISIPSGQVTNFTSSTTGLIKSGTGITITSTGGGATVSISNTTITANTYGSSSTIPSITFNNQGQAIAATAVSALITNKSQLNSSIAYIDQSNTFGTFSQSFKSSNLYLTNPSNTFAYRFVGSSITSTMSMTIPLLTSNDTFVFQSFSQSMTNKTLLSTNNNVIDATKLQTFTVSTTTPTLDNLLRWNGTSWVPSNLSSGTTYSISPTNTTSTTDVVLSGMTFSLPTGRYLVNFSTYMSVDSAIDCLTYFSIYINETKVDRSERVIFTTNAGDPNTLSTNSLIDITGNQFLSVRWRIDTSKTVTSYNRELNYIKVK